MTRGLRTAERALAGLGDGWDAVAAAVARTPGRVAAVLALRRERRVGLTAAIAMLVLYLLAIGDLAVSPSGRWVAAEGLRFAPEGLFRSRAPYLFEPVIQAHPDAHVAVLLSPVNLGLGTVVAALVGANMAVATYGARHAIACRRGYSRVLGALPAFLLGFACCVPTFVLALGAGTAAAVLPALLPLRSFFYPLTLVLLVGFLVQGTRKMTPGDA